MVCATEQETQPPPQRSRSSNWRRRRGQQQQQRPQAQARDLPPELPVQAQATMHHRDGEEWLFPTKWPENHDRHLLALMGCCHGTRHARGTTFTKEALLQLTPSVIKNWMAFKTYGKEEYDPAIDNPMGARALHLHQAKKGISHFMPNNAPQWMDGKGGNPTKSRAMNKLMGDVLKAENPQKRSSKPSQTEAHTKRIPKTDGTAETTK